eukprot:8752853-Heterocapsa_arctica.AAC.1
MWLGAPAGRSRTGLVAFAVPRVHMLMPSKNHHQLMEGSWGWVLWGLSFCGEAFPCGRHRVAVANSLPAFRCCFVGQGFHLVSHMGV